MKPELKFPDEKKMLYTSAEYEVEKQAGTFSAVPLWRP